MAEWILVFVLGGQPHAFSEGPVTGAECVRLLQFTANDRVPALCVNVHDAGVVIRQPAPNGPPNPPPAKRRPIQPQKGVM